MEHLRSPAGATVGNRWQMGRARKPLKRADPQLVATHGNGFGAHGKEGVDGSRPSEGSANGLHVRHFSIRIDFARVERAVRLEPRMEPSAPKLARRRARTCSYLR